MKLHVGAYDQARPNRIAREADAEVQMGVVLSSNHFFRSDLQKLKDTRARTHLESKVRGRARV